MKGTACLLQGIYIDIGERLIGDIDILVGTHALIEDSVQFKSLGIVIIDEQHRFGVAQRGKLWKKNKLYPPHILVMTATPIPRTLVLTNYGDMNISTIKKKLFYCLYIYIRMHNYYYAFF